MFGIRQQMMDVHPAVPPATATPVSASDESLTPGQQMMASGIGAMFVATLMTPLDVVKIRLQAQDRFHSKKCFLYSNGIMDHVYLRTNGDPPLVPHSAEEICNCKWYNRPKYFNGTLDAFVKISRVEGVRSLWSGLGPTLALALPTTVVYLTSYEQLKKAFHQSDPEHRTAASMFSGILSRTLACTAVGPLELVRTKMQSQKMAYHQVLTAVRKMAGEGGVRSLWKGYTATLMRDVPFSAVYWPIYEGMRPGEYRFRKTLAAGATSGAVAAVLTLPFDIIKTRRQMELGELMASGKRANGTHGNVFVAKEVFRTQGVAGFFTGITPRVLKVAPACAIMITSYEYCKRWFALRNMADKKGSDI